MNAAGVITPPVQPSGRGATFRELYGRRSGCLPGDYAERVFWQVLYPHATLLARLVWAVNRGYFREDLDLIEQVGDLTSSEDVKIEVRNFRYYQPVAGPFHGWLRIRISGQRLLNLAYRVFARHQRVQLPPPARPGEPLRIAA